MEGVPRLDGKFFVLPQKQTFVWWDAEVLFGAVVLPLLLHGSRNTLFTLQLLDVGLAAGALFWFLPRGIVAYQTFGKDSMWRQAVLWSVVCVVLVVVQLLCLHCPGWLHVAEWAGYLFGTVVVACVLYDSIKAAVVRSRLSPWQRDGWSAIQLLPPNGAYHRLLVVLLALVFWVVQ